MADTEVGTCLPPPSPVPMQQLELATESSPSVQESKQAGLVNNDSMTEEEMNKFWAAGNVAAEEERLAKEREERENLELEQKLKDSTDMLGPLKAEKFQALDELLTRSQQYTVFLSEQLNTLNQRNTNGPRQAAGSTEEVAEVEPKKRKGVRGKRTAAAANELPAKRLKPGMAATKELCPLLEAELRDYQLLGVKWMISLWQNGLNGILADQMGLGKTVQTIGFLSHLKSKGVNGPFLVVGPLSTLPNWVDEFRRFCPQLPALLYHGTRDERAQLQKDIKPRVDPKGFVGADFPVLCTSYEIIMADIQFFQKISFKYVIVDEGHRLKNFNCRLIRELRTISAGNKLLLSGTPLQNNLAELWSLLNFLVPDIFSSLQDFESWFDFSSMVKQTDIDQESAAIQQQERIISKLHSILQPFVLRRVKSDVEIDLPRKQEIILYAGMTDVQKNINQNLLEGTLKEEMAKVAKDEGRSSGISLSKLNNVLMQMRKNANHPDLIVSAFTNELDYPPPDVLVAQSGKMQLMDRLLKRLFKDGHKVLIFSQMTTMLDLLESYLEQQGHQPCRIDGSIAWQERQESITAFNTDPARKVFLLSTRAGGLGINLTAADTVIIYDSDWNPQQDMQAMDRCHRIGQTKPVLIFRLATAQSVEGKMLRRAGEKLALERLVIKKGAFKTLVAQEQAGQSANMNASELMELLKADYSVDDVPQSGVVTDKTLDKLLDRKHLQSGSALPYPQAGVGYEVVKADDGSGLLKGVNN